MSKKQTAESFWRRVKVGDPEECWEWTGSRNNTGYGTVAWDGAVWTAHRVAAFLSGLVESAKAPDEHSDDGHVLHKCDNRACCNPHHFFLGNYTANQKDAYSKGRRSQPKGEKHSNAKLSNEEAREIREKYSTGLTQAHLAKEYGVSQIAISLIVRRKTYV